MDNGTYYTDLILLGRNSNKLDKTKIIYYLNFLISDLCSKQ